MQQCVQLTERQFGPVFTFLSAPYIPYLPNTNCHVTVNMPSEFKTNIHSAFFFYIFQISCDDENRKYYFKYNYHTFLSKRTRVGKRFSQKLYSYSHKCIKSEGKCENYARPSSGGCVTTLPYRYTALPVLFTQHIQL